MPRPLANQVSSSGCLNPEICITIILPIITTFQGGNGRSKIDFGSEVIFPVRASQLWCWHIDSSIILVEDSHESPPHHAVYFWA